MGYIAEENDIRDTVLDFITFCDFVETKKPFATQKGDLSTKACFEVNQLLRYPAKNAKHTDRIYQYASVSLWFLIAKEAGLIACGDKKNGKAIYNTTEIYLDFKKMNLFSQYLLIYNIWFCFVDIEVQYNERGSSYLLSRLIDRVFAQLSKHSSTQWIQTEKYDYQMFDSSPVQVMMEHYYKTAHNLLDLGLLVFEEGDRLSKYYHCPVIEKIKPTHFGSCVMNACEYRKYSWFNVFVETEVMEEEIEAYEKTMGAMETESFLTPFIKCFPQDSIDIAAIHSIIYEYEGVDNDNRIFECKVALDKKCYRVIRCLPKHTFESFHLAIQEAFDFANDHLYSFYLDGKPYSNYSVNSRYSERPPCADEVCLKDVRLRNFQNILYLFDYGDQWEFDITIHIKTDGEANFESPEITKEVGKAPRQYADYENDF